MSTTIDQIYINAYRAGLEQAINQQKGSRLAPFVSSDTQRAEFQFYDRLGIADDVNEVTTRYGDTPLNDVPFGRRRIGLRDFDWAKLVDPKDLLRVLADPTSDITQAAAWSFGRKKDDVIIAAAYGPAYTSKDGSVVLNFVGETSGTIAQGDNVATEGFCVAHDYVSTGSAATSNLTIQKMVDLRHQMLATESINVDDTIYLAMSANQMAALLRVNEVQSIWYNTIRALAEGRVSEFAGFKFIHSERLPLVNGYRACMAFLPHALKIVTAEDMMVRVNERPDKRNVPQVYVKMSMNATRMWGQQIGQILCDETK
jgi:hypothetical protein